MLVGSPLRVEPTADVVSETLRLGGVLQSMVDRLQRRPAHQPAPGEHAPWHPAHLGGAAPTPADARLTKSLPKTCVLPTWLTPTPGADRVDHDVETGRHGGPGQKEGECDGGGGREQEAEDGMGRRPAGEP